MTITIINFHNYTLTRWALHYDWLILSPTVAGGSPGGPLDHALQSTWSWYNHLHGHGWWDGEETTLTVNNMEWTLTRFIRCNLLLIHINVDMSNSRGLHMIMPISWHWHNSDPNPAFLYWRCICTSFNLIIQIRGW